MLQKVATLFRLANVMSKCPISTVVDDPNCHALSQGKRDSPCFRPVDIVWIKIRSRDNKAARTTRTVEPAGVLALRSDNLMPPRLMQSFPSNIASRRSGARAAKALFFMYCSTFTRPCFIMLSYLIHVDLVLHYTL